MINRTKDSEMTSVVLTTLTRAEKITGSEVNTAQDAMISLRIEWEELQACLRNRKIDGFEVAVDKIITLGATAMAMAAIMQAKIKNMVELQLEDLDLEEVVTPPVKKPNKKKTIK